MTNIKDFDKLFSTKPTISTAPYVALDGFSFRLLNIQPYHRWVKTGEVKQDKSPKWAQDPENIMDETGERIRCEVQLQLTDAKGVSTSTSAPFVDNKHYFSYEQLEKIVPRIGETVELINPRIELRDAATENDKGFKYVETRMVFVYDGFEI